MDLEDSMKNGLRVTNFRNGDDYTVSYPFPILSGFVTHPDGQSVKELVVTGEDNVDTVGKQENFRATWRVVNRCFRGVVRLNLGKNDFVLLAQIPSPPGLSQVVLRITVCFEPVENPEHFVLPVYIVCSDSLGSFQSENDEDGSLESAVRRISTGK
jgi:Putative peptidase family